MKIYIFLVVFSMFVLRVFSQSHNVLEVIRYPEQNDLEFRLKYPKYIQELESLIQSNQSRWENILKERREAGVWEFFEEVSNLNSQAQKEFENMFRKFYTKEYDLDNIKIEYDYLRQSHHLGDIPDEKLNLIMAVSHGEQDLKSSMSYHRDLFLEKYQVKKEDLDKEISWRQRRRQHNLINEKFKRKFNSLGSNLVVGVLAWNPDWQQNQVGQPTINNPDPLLSDDYFDVLSRPHLFSVDEFRFHLAKWVNIYVVPNNIISRAPFKIPAVRKHEITNSEGHTQNLFSFYIPEGLSQDQLVSTLKRLQIVALSMNGTDGAIRALIDEYESLRELLASLPQQNQCDLSTDGDNILDLEVANIFKKKE
ncbi:MAG: hypothetical protein HYS98_08320 [Deltaproteobacteria bacterium]|nr:hypothetical protein [Deltaproteobacteria bacterium]